MALSPIELFADRATPGILGVLQGGSGALTNIFNTAVQLGRDMVDNQMQQERSFLTEQRNEINLAQRRGELARQDFEDDRAFDQGVFERERAFDRGVEEFDRTDARLTAAQLFSQGMQGENLALARSREDRMAEESGFRLGELEREAELRDAQDAASRDILAAPERGLGDRAADIFRGTDADVRAAEADARLKAAERLGDPDAILDATREKARAEAEVEQRKARESQRLTASQGLARERFERQKTLDEERRTQAQATEQRKQLEGRQQTHLGDTEAFPPPTDSVMRQIASGADATALAAEGNRGKVAEKLRLEYETSAALAKSEEEYVKAVLPPSQRKDGSVPEEIAKKRRAFWRNARKLNDEITESAPAEVATPATPTPTAAPSAADNAVIDWINGNTRR